MRDDVFRVLTIALKLQMQFSSTKGKNIQKLSS